MGPGSAPFFVGRTADGAAVVLQHHRGRPVSLTLARFEADGTLACGERETPFLSSAMRAGRSTVRGMNAGGAPGRGHDAPLGPAFAGGTGARSTC